MNQRKEHIRAVVLLLGVITLLSPICAQESMFSIGVRTGGQTWLLSTAPDDPSHLRVGMGGTGTLDLRYSYYGFFTDNIGMGFALGLGFGYGRTDLKGTVVDRYTNVDFQDDPIDYTITSAFRQTDKFAKADLSVLMTFCIGNVVLNVGPRWMRLFATSSDIRIRKSSVDAYFQNYGVVVRDEEIMGRLKTPHKQVVASNLPLSSLLMAVEVGYEWLVMENNAIGLQAYADVAVWSGHLPVSDKPNRLVDISSITNPYSPAPKVKLNSMNGYVSRLRYIDFGVRAYYTFSVGSSRRHRYRYGRY